FFGFLFIFHFFFFRDPERTPPAENNLIIAPADGKIIKIKKVREDLYVKDEVQLVSIFMSVFNVHVNRIPISGRVELIKHKKGQFMAAWADKAIEHNEQVIIGIHNDSYGKILFVQIAGLIARRIICNLKEGEQVEKGKRFGLIKYGSRVDLYLPNHILLKVKVGDAVKAGRSIIGEFIA
ncbi:MAG TPA: phosphatidylserine decarboxylase family protein, partial [Calditrichaeota bacterium]|nr:phosphatidylserine decarboxylase family protein [Calditrichota bacterium]